MEGTYKDQGDASEQTGSQPDTEPIRTEADTIRDIEGSDDE